MVDKARIGLEPVEYYSINNKSFPLDNSYYNEISSSRSLEEIISLPTYEKSEISLHDKTNSKITFRQYASKYYELLLYYELIKRAGLVGNYNRALDIGSGPGLQIRTLKAHGHIKHIEACDLYDGSHLCSSNVMEKYSKKLRWLKHYKEITDSFPKTTKFIDKRLSNLNDKLPIGSKFYNYWPNIAPYNMPIKNSFDIDKYHTKDVYELNGEYDLITSFMALEYFDFSKIVKKVSELLAPGGVFVFLLSYWWYPINNTLLFGKIPYLLQQLNRSEVRDYYIKNHSDLNIDKIVNRLELSDPMMPLLSEYEDMSNEYNLFTVQSQRLTLNPQANPRSIIGPYNIENSLWSFKEILKNVRQHKPNANLIDLCTSHVMLVLQKR